MVLKTPRAERDVGGTTTTATTMTTAGEDGGRKTKTKTIVLLVNFMLMLMCQKLYILTALFTCLSLHKSGGAAGSLLWEGRVKETRLYVTEIALCLQELMGDVGRLRNNKQYLLSTRSVDIMKGSPLPMKLILYSLLQTIPFAVVFGWRVARDWWAARAAAKAAKEAAKIAAMESGVSFRICIAPRPSSYRRRWRADPVLTKMENKYFLRSLLLQCRNTRHGWGLADFATGSPAFSSDPI